MKNRVSSRPACSPPTWTTTFPAIMREINSLYDVDCFYTNGWPPHRQPAELPLRDL